LKSGFAAGARLAGRASTRLLKKPGLGKRKCCRFSKVGSGDAARRDCAEAAAAPSTAVVVAPSTRVRLRDGHGRLFVSEASEEDLAALGEALRALPVMVALRDGKRASRPARRAARERRRAADAAAAAARRRRAVRVAAVAKAVRPLRRRRRRAGALRLAGSRPPG
jgi:hypothetical protein